MIFATLLGFTQVLMGISVLKSDVSEQLCSRETCMDEWRRVCTFALLPLLVIIECWEHEYLWDAVALNVSTAAFANCEDWKKLLISPKEWAEGEPCGRVHELCGSRRTHWCGVGV